MSDSSQSPAMARFGLTVRFLFDTETPKSLPIGRDANRSDVPELVRFLGRLSARTEDEVLDLLGAGDPTRGAPSDADVENAVDSLYVLYQVTARCSHDGKRPEAGQIGFDAALRIVSAAQCDPALLVEALCKRIISEPGVRVVINENRNNWEGSFSSRLPLTDVEARRLIAREDFGTILDRLDTGNAEWAEAAADAAVHYASAFAGQSLAS